MNKYLYLRNKDGTINRIVGEDKIKETIKVLEKHNPTHIEYSTNLKDLIKIGDIVRWSCKWCSQYGVNEVIWRFGQVGVYAIEYDNLIELKDIKISSVVTSEQFREMAKRNKTTITNI